VFSRSRSAQPDTAAPAVGAQLSPFLESAALSISFSIKGAARDLPVVESGASFEEGGPEKAADSVVDSLAADAGSDIAGVAAKIDGQTRQGQQEGEIDDARETSQSLNLLAFGDFPEGEGGTAHDEADQPEQAVPEDAGLSGGVEPQLDQPEFLEDRPGDDQQHSAGDADSGVSQPDSRQLLNARGKKALSFDNGTDAYALPEAVSQTAAGLASAAMEGFNAPGGTETQHWASIRIPSSIAELSRGNQRKRQVALTFDDGPHQEYTEQILSILDYYDVPATFFFVGIQCVKHPDLVQKAYQRGDEIGSQTYDHFRLPNLPRDEKEYQIDEYQLLIKRLCGAEPRFLRPPGGQVDDQTKALLKERGIVLALWDVALNDTRDGKTAAEMLATAKARVRPGSVILAHDGVKATVELLPQLIEELRRQDYEFVTMSQLAADLQ
jgi:peptidoglycan/xylan/chitin deacetylase (PgdA/CDA1 family)